MDRDINIKYHKAPVLLICFNRLYTVKKTLERIKYYEPQELYVAIDGPRANFFEEDKQQILTIREWVSSYVDWSCSLKIMVHEKNLGCGMGPVSAINWMFKFVDCGIILEDDCIPNEEFFPYCEVLLDLYKNDKTIYAINGSQFLPNRLTSDSYYFSMQNSPLWGWATWKRAWIDFDYDLQSSSMFGVITDMLWYRASLSEILWWTTIYKQFRSGVFNNSTWDYQFIFSIWHHHGLSIMPNLNLISNIGFDSQSTHTVDPQDKRSCLLTHSILPLTHPKSHSVCRKADELYHIMFYEQLYMGDYSVTKILKRIIKKGFSTFAAKR